jgi:hypothetical protein
VERSAVSAVLSWQHLIFEPESRIPKCRSGADITRTVTVRLFGLATGDPITDRIREAVEASPNGLSRNQIGRLFYGHVGTERIDTALEQLAAFGALYPYTQQTGGRRSTIWLDVQHQ